MRRRPITIAVAAVAALILGSVVLFVLFAIPSLGAGGLLHPMRHRVAQRPALSYVDVSFAGDGVTLQGWAFPCVRPRRGTLVYLHGIADNRGSSAGAAERFTRRGFDVIAYDSRAHGESGGDACTYGYYEKRDLRRVIDTIPDGPVVVVGASLGGAVALQAAATDPRIRAVVAAETFSDLRTVATERAPFFFFGPLVARAFRLAEAEGRFTIDDVSPVRAAANIRVPVLLVHGEADRDTSPAHSQRIFDALRGPKRLILVPGAGHNASLRRPATWREIEIWIDQALGE